MNLAVKDLLYGQKRNENEEMETLTRKNQLIMRKEISEKMKARLRREWRQKRNMVSIGSGGKGT